MVYEGGSRLGDRLKPAYGDWETVGCCLVSMVDIYAVAWRPGRGDDVEQWTGRSNQSRREEGEGEG